MAKAPPAAVIALAQKAKNGLRSLERRMAPPQFAALDFISDMWSFQIAFALVDLDVPDAIGDGSRSAAEIAPQVGADADHLYRLLRAASNVDLVREEEGKRFTLRPMGDALRRRDGDSIRDFILFMGKVGWRFWGRFTDSIRQGKTAIEIETGKKPFEFLLGEPETAELFNRAMSAVSAVAADAFVAAYDTASLRKVVDVGGGHGRLLSAIMNANQQLQGVLFDLPEVVAGAPPMLRKHGVEGRIEIVGGDFFKEVPQGGDLYVLKTIIHDWQDEEASKILASLRRAISPSGRIALYETVVPRPNEKHFAKLLDLEMIVHGGGRERTEAEYAALFQRAGFRLNRVIPTAGPMSIVEAMPG